MEVLIVEYGSVASKRGKRLLIDGSDIDKPRAVPLELVTSLALLTGCHLTASLQAYCYQRGIPISFLNRSGRLRCLITGSPRGPVSLRRRQYQYFPEGELSRVFSRAVVGVKIYNGYRMLREKVKGELRPGYERLRRRSLETVTRSTLRGIEGTASRYYFAHLRELVPSWLQFERRMKRGARDPLNGVLSFLYSRLYQLVMSQLIILGLDPYLGFYHQVSHGHAALASDMMEAFRSDLCDRVALRLLRKGELREEHFQRDGQRWSLDRRGYQLVLGAFQRRILATRTIGGWVHTWLEIVRRDCRGLATSLVNPEIPFQPWRSR